MKQSKLFFVVVLSSLIFFSCKDDLEDAKKDVSKGLIAYYTFDDENANDISGNKYHGILINSPGFVSDSPNGSGKSIFLNGFKEQFVNIPYNPFFDQNDYSISMWIKDFGSGILFSGISNDYVRSDYPRLIARNNGTFTFYTGYDNYDSTDPFLYQYDPLQDEVWHLITVVNEWDQNIYSSKCIKKLYIDGKLVDSMEGSISKSSQGECTKMHIGGDGAKKYTSFTSSMKVDNIRFYTRVLSDLEVEAIYISEK